MKLFLISLITMFAASAFGQPILVKQEQKTSISYQSCEDAAEKLLARIDQSKPIHKIILGKCNKISIRSKQRYTQIAHVEYLLDNY